MLFRKTFRNALATLLGTALALATGVAHAEINLDATGTATSPIGTVTFSAETLLSNATTDQGGVSYYNLFPSSADFRVSAKLGVTGRNDRRLYIRYDFGNMVARLQIDSGWITIPDINGAEAGATALVADNILLEGGGGRGQNFVVFSVEATAVNAPLASDALVVAAAHNRLALRQGAPGTLRMRVYVGLSEALRGETAVTDTGAKTVANIAPSLITAPLPGNVTATVSSGFTAISGTGANAGRIGRLAISLVGLGSTDTRPAHKSVVNGADVNTLAQVAQAANAQLTSGSRVTFTGDFTVGRYIANTHATGDCGSANQALTTTRNNQVLDSVVFAAGLGLTSLCIALPAGNTDEIPAGQYTVAVDYAKLTNAAVEPADLGETTLGTIRRDGTRVQIPYLTTYSGYTQRVVIVNRNRGAVRYTFSFVSEDGTVATAGDAATGSVPANSTMVLKATDIVSLAGKTRTAAVLDVVAPNGTVDIATTQVNMDDQGTDTVIYETTGT